MPLTLAPDATEFISLPEVKAHANVTGSASDDELDLFRGAAQDAVEGLIGPVLPRTVTETHSPGRHGTVVLRKFPLLSVDVITRHDVAVTGFTTDLDIGLLRGVGSSPVTVTYTAGRTVVPDAVRVAALIIAEHLWVTQRGGGPGFVDDLGAPSPGMAYSIPNRATDLLRPYLLPPAVG